MNRTIKAMASIFILLMLATTVISIVTPSGPYTGCLSTTATKRDSTGIFYNVIPGLTPSSTCKTNDYQISLYEKTYVDNTISFLSDQINSLSNRITNLENSPGISGYETVVKEFPSPGRFHIGGNVDCPPGKKPLGGGIEGVTQSALSGTLYTMDSFPTINGWYGSVFNTDYQDASFKIHVTCADVQ